jgi:hypothetical protein
MLTPLLESFPAHSNFYKTTTSTMGAALFAAMGKGYLVGLVKLCELGS